MFNIGNLPGFGLIVLLMAAAHQSLGADECALPRLGDDQIIAVISKVRDQYASFPKKIPNAKITVKRERCFYEYEENEVVKDEGANLLSHAGWLRVLINQYGEIIDVYPRESAHDFLVSMQCKQALPSKEWLVDRLRETIRKDPSIPRLPPNAEIMLSSSKAGCKAWLIVIPFKDNPSLVWDFKFDRHGDLYDFVAGY